MSFLILLDRSSLTFHVGEIVKFKAWGEMCNVSSKQDGRTACGQMEMLRGLIRVRRCIEYCYMSG